MVLERNTLSGYKGYYMWFCDIAVHVAASVL